MMDFVPFPDFIETHVLYEEQDTFEHSNTHSFWDNSRPFCIKNNIISKAESTKQRKSMYSRMVFNSRQYKNMIIRFKLEIDNQNDQLLIGFSNQNHPLNQLFCGSEKQSNPDNQSFTSNETNNTHNDMISSKSDSKTSHNNKKSTKKSKHPKASNTNHGASSATTKDKNGGKRRIFYAINSSSGQRICHTTDEWHEWNEQASLKSNDCVIFELNFACNHIKYQKFGPNGSDAFESIIFSNINVDNVDYRLAVSSSDSSLSGNSIKILKCSVWTHTKHLVAKCSIVAPVPIIVPEEEQFLQNLSVPTDANMLAHNEAHGQQTSSSSCSSDAPSGAQTFFSSSQSTRCGSRGVPEQKNENDSACTNNIAFGTRSNVHVANIKSNNNHRNPFQTLNPFSAFVAPNQNVSTSNTINQLPFLPNDCSVGTCQVPMISINSNFPNFPQNMPNLAPPVASQTSAIKTNPDTNKHSTPAAAMPDMALLKSVSNRSNIPNISNFPTVPHVLNLQNIQNDFGLALNAPKIENKSQNIQANRVHSQALESIHVRSQAMRMQVNPKDENESELETHVLQSSALDALISRRKDVYDASEQKLHQFLTEHKTNINKIDKNPKDEFDVTNDVYKIDLKRCTNSLDDWMQDSDEIKSMWDGDAVVTDIRDYEHAMNLVSKQKNICSNEVMNLSKQLNNAKKKTTQAIKSTKSALKKEEKRSKKMNEEMKGLAQNMNDIIARFGELLEEFDTASDKIVNCEMKQHESQSSINLLSDKLEALNSFKADVVSLVSKKDQLANTTREYGDKLLQRCQQQYWSHQESKWFTWHVEDIINWIRHNLALASECKLDVPNMPNMSSINIDVSKIDFDKIVANMNNERYKGKYLYSIEASELANYFGTALDSAHVEGDDNSNRQSEDIINLLCELIECMCDKYPMPRKKSRYSVGNSMTAPDEPEVAKKEVIAAEAAEAAGGSNVSSNAQETPIADKADNITINRKYLCPISKKLMKQPVLDAVNGHTFEKENIVQYWKQHRKDPITHEAIVNVDEAIGLLHDNLILKGEIEAKFGQKFSDATIADVEASELESISDVGADQSSTAALSSRKNKKESINEHFTGKQDNSEMPPKKKRKTSTKSRSKKSKY